MQRRLGLFVALFLFAAASTVAAQGGRVITGTVTDSTSGEPIPSVLIQVRGSTIEATTRSDGTYQLVNVSLAPVQLVFRIIGYKSLAVDVASGQNTVNAQLARDILRIEELVVSGRATAVSRQNLANSVATVSGAEIVEVPAQSIEHALQGKVAGADIQTNSGAPGGGAQIRLRGVTTINAGAVARGGTATKTGVRNRARTKSTATVTAVRPVRPPSRESPR